MRPVIDVHPLADRSSGREEKVIAFRSDKGGGLISFAVRGNALHVHLFRVDPDVTITIEDRDP